MSAARPFIHDLGKSVLIAVASLPMLACASMPSHGEAAISDPTLPSNDEVVAYVQAHWPSYSETTSRFQNRPGEAISLIRVYDVSCARYYGIPDCRFTVTVSIGNEPPIEQHLSSMFDRYPDGTLFETIVLVHERRR